MDSGLSYFCRHSYINLMDMKKTLFFALVVAYIITAFGLGDGFEMNLIPFNWDIFLLIKFAIFFILTVIIESFFIKKKK